VTQFSEPERERFKREARILAKLSHPNIPAIYDVAFSEHHFWILFQFIDGITLRKQIEKEGPCELGDVRRWFAQIASALDHANSLEIIHRDIKPDNIIITPNRESAYLVDFGIALSADEIRKLTQSGYAVGTPGYMSPEQNAGEQLDARSDVYSLAVTLYEALAGRSIPVGTYGELSSANEAIPPQIDDLIRDCLLPKNRRLGSAREFSSRLAGALRPLKPLSEVLAHGRLHELAGAIEELTPDEFVRLPLGQRDLVLLKLGDIVGSGEAELQFASGRFLELLVPRAIHLPSNDYRDIIRPAIQWGFKREFGDRIGREGLRRELENAAFTARAEAHTVLREEFGLFLKNEDLADKDDWWLHAIRQVLQTLLSNPACTAGTENLVERLKEVNRIQRSRREIR
jgi:serine/threonine-protein kinase